ncbi:MAG: AI-2E family transporter [Elusimicrobiales bacterium]|nr:AI-2E family transporter [Elusimicrobiales bacterium]
MEHNKSLNKRFIINIIFAVFTLLFLYGFVKLIIPFLSAFFLSIIFAIVFYPVYEFFLKKKINNTISAFLAIFCFLFTIVIPSIIFGWLLINEVKDIYPQTISYLNQNMPRIKVNLPEFIPLSSFDLDNIIISNIGTIQQVILKYAGNVIKNIFFFFVNFFVMILSMFFFFKDGKNLLKWLMDIIPLNKNYLEKISFQFSSTTNAIIRGVVLTAFIQGIIASIGFYIAGISSPLLLGFFVILSAFVPFIGTTLVTIPVAVFAFFKSTGSGVFLLVWGVLIVGVVDNLIRPIFIGKGAKLPLGLVFLGILGGIKAYGPIGIFVGPIFVSIIITILEMYKENANTLN